MRPAAVAGSAGQDHADPCPFAWSQLVFDNTGLDGPFC
jgi:hypothetical protein